MRRSILALAVSAAVFGSAHAGSVVTTSKGATVMHPDDGTSVTFNKDTPEASTHDQCVKAVQDLFKGTTIKAQCWDSTVVTVTANCDGVSAPHIALTKDANGSWLEPDARAAQVDANTWTTEQYLYIPNPAWPQGFPDCWVRGWASPEDWRVNGTDPNAPFMEHKEPGMADLPDELPPEGGDPTNEVKNG